MEFPTKEQLKRSEERAYKKILEKLILNEWQRPGGQRISKLQLLSVTEYFGLRKQLGEDLLNRFKKICSEDSLAKNAP